MSIVELSFNLYCHRPPWSIHHWDRRISTSMYRVYVNTDLITERTWIWDNHTFLVENLLVDLDLKRGHTVKVEPVIYIPDQAQFKILDFKLLNTGGQANSISDVELYFTLE